MQVVILLNLHIIIYLLIHGSNGVAYVRNVKAEYDSRYEAPSVTTEKTGGKINMPHIAWGNYYIKETKPAEGYEEIDTKYSFTVNRETFRNNNTIITEVLNNDTNEEVSVIKNNRKRGKVTLTKYACDASGNETTNVLEGAIYELYASNGTLIGEYTTDEYGKIVVENLDWDSYYFIEKQATIGYSTSDKKISFVINSKNVNYEQQLVAYDELESGELTINKVINKDDIYSAHGNSTFMFKIVGKDGDNEKITYYRAITFTENDINNADINGNITKTIKISDVAPYIYEITEEENYRFNMQTIIPVTTNAEVDGNVGIITLGGAQNKGEITFKNEKTTNSLLSDSTLITNTTQSEYYVVGLTVEQKEESYVVGSILTKDDFKYTLLYSGGQEISVEADVFDSITFDGNDTYTQAVSGNYIANIEIRYKERVYEFNETTKWFYLDDHFIYEVIDETNKTIAITGLNNKYSALGYLYIPSEYNGYKVEEVRCPTGYYNYPMKNVENIKKVEIADGVTKIGNSAFSGLATGSDLTSIKMPEGLTEIGECAFNECKGLTSIEIPEGVTSIGLYAFNNCNSLSTINYHGTPEQFAAIRVSQNNAPFEAATVNYITD